MPLSHAPTRGRYSRIVGVIYVLHGAQLNGDWLKQQEKVEGLRSAMRGNNGEILAGDGGATNIIGDPRDQFQASDQEGISHGEQRRMTYA